MNPDTTIIPIHGSIITNVGIGLFRECDVVIGCLDNREARLWVNRMCWRVETPWVDGGIQEINGVVKVFTPPHGACYECAMTENDYRLINLRYSCPLLKRDDILAGKVPTSPTISSIIAGIQCQEALKLIHGMPVKDGGAFVFNGIANSTYQSNFQHREDCLSHETFPPPIETNLTISHTVQDLFEHARENCEGLSSGTLRLILDRDLVVSLKCHVCQTEKKVMKCAQDVGATNAQCECGELMRPEMVNQIESESELASCSLAEVGIPAFDIVRVQSEEEREYFLLADESYV